MPLKCPQCDKTLKKEALICTTCGKRGLFIKSSENTYSDLLTHFPNWMTPRLQQRSILKKIAKGIDDGFIYILLDAGTGIGKSAVATTLARYFGSAYIVTITKQLQDQYYEDFKFQVLKGRNNFNCIEGLAFNKDVNCEDGICQNGDIECDHGVTRKGDIDRDREYFAFYDSYGAPWFFNSANPCYYWLQKSKSIQSPITLMNYASFFPEMNYVSHFGNRVLTVFDEVHNMENQVMNQISFNLSNKQLNKDFKDQIDDITKIGEIRGIPQLDDEAYTDDTKFWIEYLLNFIKDYKSLLQIKDLTPKKRKSIYNKVLSLNLIRDELQNHPKDWVIEVNKPKEKIMFKPIEVNRFVPKYLLDHSDYNLLMSATILNKDHFCKWHGINPEKALYIQVKSPFKVENRPIYLKTAGKMSKNYVEDTKPRSIGVLKAIMAKHINDKGLIHTHSHKLASYIKEKINDPRIIIYSPNNDSNNTNREDIIRRFKRSKDPMILVAPSVDEGVDFPDDMCRFQVIYKIPFPYLGDKQIKARMSRDGYWYAYKTVASLVQAYGRGMRNENDYCDSYILDDDIYSVMADKWRKCIYFLPEYFNEAVVRIRQI